MTPPNPTRNRTTATRAAVLAATLAALASTATPADAQRPATRDATRTTETTKMDRTSRTSPSTPLQDAAALKRAGRSAGQAAVALSRRHRMRSDAVASTLIRVGYAPGPVGRALVDDMKVAAERAAADLERAGVRDPRELYGALLQMTASRTDAMKILRVRKGSRQALVVIRNGGEEEPPTAEEAAEHMDEAGFSLEEIVEVLMSDPYGLSAEAILVLFLELKLGSPNNDPSTYELLREKGLDAREAAAAATNAGVGSDALASILASAGYTWDEIVDALEWTGETALDATRIAVDAGAPLADMVRWLIDTEKATLQEILDGYQDQLRFVLEIILENSERKADVLEASTAAHDAGMSLDEIVEVLIDHGLSAAEIAQFLADEGLSFEEIAELLDDKGLASDQIAQALSNLGANLAQLTAILTTILGLSHDAAMAIIGNI